MSTESCKTKIKILANPGLALSRFEQPGPEAKPRLFKRKTADLSSVSTQLFRVAFAAFLVFIFSKKNNVFFSFSKKYIFQENATKMLE